MPANPEVLRIYVKRGQELEKNIGVVGHMGSRKLGEIQPEHPNLNNEDFANKLRDQGHEVQIASVGAQEQRVIILEPDKIRIPQKTQSSK